MHAYKNVATRRYLHLAVDGRAFAIAGDRYEEITPREAVEAAFDGWEDAFPQPEHPGGRAGAARAPSLSDFTGNALGPPRDCGNACDMPNIGPMELAIVAVIALLVLGPKRLPSAGRSLGRGIREFRDGIGGAGERRARRGA